MVSAYRMVVPIPYTTWLFIQWSRVPCVFVIIYRYYGIGSSFQIFQCHANVEANRMQDNITTWVCIHYPSDF